MDTKIKLNEADAELKAAFSQDVGEKVVHNEAVEEKPAPDTTEKQRQKPKRKWQKSEILMMAGGMVGVIGGATCILFAVLQPSAEFMEVNFPKIPSIDTANVTYSTLTGEVLANADKKDAPIYCIQTPNGTDGARPQAGLNRAGVIFEAIAEAGITRFAGIYQDPATSIIGPIRSLRMYYLQWDTPFDCVIVHAGGADDALNAVRSGGYKDLSEDYSYMYRGTYGSRLWNNLFTTSSALERFSSEHNYNSAEAKGFARMTPEESDKLRVDTLAMEKLDIVKPTSSDTSALNGATTAITLRFGGTPNFNVSYTYDTKSNKYLRSYESGLSHDVYDCEAGDLGERNPEDACTLTQMSPSVVIAMVVQESRATDNYHESITTTGSGDAYIFQNGMAIKGRWTKESVADQIKFTDEDGKEVKLAPGQTIISAIPGYGSIDF